MSGASWFSVVIWHIRGWVATFSYANRAVANIADTLNVVHSALVFGTHARSHRRNASDL